MAKSGSVDKSVKRAVDVALIITLFFMAYAVFQVWDSSPRALPQRVLPLPAPEQIGDGEKVIYAKEALPVKGLGTYTVKGYLKASQPLSDAVGVYRRTQDPGEDPTCKVLTVPSQRGNPNSSVYVCERGRSDVEGNVAKFTNTKFAPFCFSPSATLGVNDRREFWIGVGWNPLLPHPLTFVFDDLAAVKVVNLPLASYPCDSVSW
jgi:hypothetical protein